MAPDQTKTSNGGEPATPEIAAPRRKLDTAPYTLISQGAEAVRRAGCDWSSRHGLLRRSLWSTSMVYR